MAPSIDPLLDVPAVVAATSLSRSTISRMEARGEFPGRVQITPYRVGWRASAIHEWLQSREPGKAAGPGEKAHEALRAKRRGAARVGTRRTRRGSTESRAA